MNRGTLHANLIGLLLKPPYTVHPDLSSFYSTVRTQLTNYHRSCGTASAAITHLPVLLIFSFQLLLPPLLFLLPLLFYCSTVLSTLSDQVTSSGNDEIPLLSMRCQGKGRRAGQGKTSGKQSPKGEKTFPDPPPFSLSSVSAYLSLSICPMITSSSSRGGRVAQEKGMVSRSRSRKAVRHHSSSLASCQFLSLVTKLPLSTPR